MDREGFIVFLLGSGGRRWQKDGHDRVYIPAEIAAKAIGLRVSRYKSGNISGATLDGERVSNTLAREMLEQLGGVYFDVKTSKWRNDHVDVGEAMERRYAASPIPTPRLVPEKTGEVCERCEKCGQTPSYRPLMLCTLCWPT